MSTTFALQESTRPLGYLITGPLADRIMEPLMMPGGGLAGMFGPLVGTGPGAGMALMYIGSAVLAIAVCLLAYIFPAIRHVEDDGQPVPAAVLAIARDDEFDCRPRAVRLNCSRNRRWRRRDPAAVAPPSEKALQLRSLYCGFPAPTSRLKK